MEYKILSENLNEEKIKCLSPDERIILCNELRDKIISTVSKNGGHLASNLGVVELTVALLSVFDYKKDKIIWDVGHQSYSYKLLTGRFDRFDSLRQEGGISGFPRISESPYDRLDTGHSSTSVSAAVGLARARDLKGEDNYVVAVIGDGSLNSGLAYEAINDIGQKKSRMLIILNDNEMSIDRNVGGLSKHLANIRVNSGYISAKHSTESFLKKEMPVLGKPIMKLMIAIKDWFRFIVYRKKPTIFEDLGLLYYGIVDGHDTESLIKNIDAVKDLSGPVLLHIVTRKGKGYKPAEDTPSDFHGVSGFDIATGKISSCGRSYTSVFGNKMIELSMKDKKIAVICAAMAQGTGLVDYSFKFPERFFDCGIAEEHCVTMAAGLALEGFKPVVAIYSTFIQRAYDEILHDICYMNLHVVFAMDRAGLVGNDGHTHHGLYDLNMFCSMPNMTVIAPRDYKSLQRTLEYATGTVEGPCAIRYPRGSEEINTYSQDMSEPSSASDDYSDIIMPYTAYDKGNEYCIISIGTSFADGQKAVSLLEDQGIPGKHVNLVLVKPLDSKVLNDITSGIRYVFTLEEGITEGGAGTYISHLLSTDHEVTNIGVNDPVIRAASQARQKEIAAIDGRSVADRIIKTIKG